MVMFSWLGKALGRSVCIGAVLAAFSGTALAVALAPPTSDSSNNGTCNTTGSQNCSFSNSGLQSTFVSGSNVYGSIFSSGISSATGNNGTGGVNTSGISRFALSTRDTGVAAAGAGSKWNAWVALSYNEVGYKYQPLQSGGHVGVSLVGIDYTFGSNLTVGLVAGWDRSRIGTSFNGGSLNSDGHIVSPYLSWRIDQAWTLDASAGFGSSNITQTDYSVAGGIFGGYKDKRSLATVSLSYMKMINKWVLTGRGTLMASEDKYDQFTLSNGTTIASATSRTTQLRVGGQAMYNGGVFLPYFGAYYFNDIDRSNSSSSTGQNAPTGRDGVQFQLGIQFAPKSPIYGGLMIASDVGRSNVKNDMILGNIGLRF